MFYLAAVADLLCRKQYNWNLGRYMPEVIMWVWSIIPLIEEELNNEEGNVWKWVYLISGSDGLKT